MEGRQRRSFTDDYKRQAIDLVASSGRAIGSVAKDLGLRDSVLRRWVELRGAGREPTAALRRPTTQATLPSADHAAGIGRLQRENERVRMGGDILQKSLAICQRTGALAGWRAHRKIPRRESRDRTNRLAVHGVLQTRAGRD